jgi:hypothetical protein
MAEQSQEQVQAQDLDVDAAMLEHAEALMTTGDPVDAPPTDDAIAAAMVASDEVTADELNEEYDAAVDDTDEEDSAEEDSEFNADADADADVDHDVVEDSAEVAPIDDAALLAAMAPDSAPLAPHPPAPGTPESPFRKCDCIGTMPGRACIRCGGSRWTKACPQTACGGRGTLSTPNRNASGPPRVERCGFCMGRGLVPARGAEVNEAQNLHNDAVAAEKQRKAQQVFAGVPASQPVAPKEIQRRKPVLPSAGKPKQKPKSKPAAKKKK